MAVEVINTSAVIIACILICEARSDALCWNVFCSRKHTLAFPAKCGRIFLGVAEPSSLACFLVCRRRLDALRYPFDASEQWVKEPG